jgi:hypothetical protein
MRRSHSSAGKAGSSSVSVSWTAISSILLASEAIECSDGSTGGAIFRRS